MLAVLTGMNCYLVYFVLMRQINIMKSEKVHLIITVLLKQAWFILKSTSCRYYCWQLMNYVWNESFAVTRDRNWKAH